MKKMLFALLLCPMLTMAGFAAESVPAASGGKSTLQSVNLSTIREFGKDALVKKNPFKTAKLDFNTYFIAPRQLLRMHLHPAADEVFYIVEGKGQFTVGNDQVMVEPGSSVYGPANVPHGVINSGNAEMVVISVQAPTPVEITAVPNSSLKCAVCGQEVIPAANAKEGDIYVCPRCHAKLKLSKAKDGSWIGTPQ